VGSGCGRAKKTAMKKNVMTANETEDARYGFTRYLLSCPFMAAPQVCRAPPRMMKGKIQLMFM
jgi:hypothetical protein